MKNKLPLIAILTNHDDDIYCFRKELIYALKNNGYDIMISCPYGPKLELMDLSMYLYDNPEIDRRGTNPVRDIKLILHYFRVLSKFKPDVVLTYTAKPNIYAGFAAYLKNIPFISNVTGFGSLLFENGLKKKISMFLYKTILRKAYCLMFQNHTNFELADKNGMVNGKYRIIPGSGVNLNKFTVSTYPSGGNGKSGDKVVFNYIGRIVHDKGVDDFISAAKIIKKEYPETEFNMLGFIEPTEIHYKDELNNLTEAGIINYLGQQNDVRPFIDRSHCTIHPSYGEGMCNSLLETAASGRPIITTDVQGCRETVKENISGYIYHHGNINELTEAIRKFLSLSNNDRKEMGLEGRKYIAANFSRELVINEYLNTIHTVIGGE